MNDLLNKIKNSLSNNKNNEITQIFDNELEKLKNLYHISHIISNIKNTINLDILIEEKKEEFLKEIKKIDNPYKFQINLTYFNFISTTEDNIIKEELPKHEDLNFVFLKLLTETQINELKLFFPRFNNPLYSNDYEANPLYIILKNQEIFKQYIQNKIEKFILNTKFLKCLINNDDYQNKEYLISSFKKYFNNNSFSHKELLSTLIVKYIYKDEEKMDQLDLDLISTIFNHNESIDYSIYKYIIKEDSHNQELVKFFEKHFLLKNIETPSASITNKPIAKL